MQMYEIRMLDVSISIVYKISRRDLALNAHIYTLHWKNQLPQCSLPCVHTPLACPASQIQEATAAPLVAAPWRSLPPWVAFLSFSPWVSGDQFFTLNSLSTVHKPLQLCLLADNDFHTPSPVSCICIMVIEGAHKHLSLLLSGRLEEGMKATIFHQGCRGSIADSFWGNGPMGKENCASA